MKINEIYQSIEGEMSGHSQGALTTFIRFQGCNLRCDYCDSKFTWSKDIGEDNWSPKEIVDKVKEYGNENVTITGGEPLMQKRGLISLVKRLHDENCNVAIETNGTYPLPKKIIEDDVYWIVDYKWGMNEKQKDTIFGTINNLHDGDIVKFIIGNKEDFENAIRIKDSFDMYLIQEDQPKFAFSPMHGKLSAKRLVSWLLSLNEADKLNLYLNTQLHKYIWKSTERGV